MEWPKCSICNTSILYGHQLSVPCKDCRINNPLTPDKALKIFEDGGTISDGTFHYFKDFESPIIRGSCSEGTCDMDSEDFAEWLENHFDPKSMEVD